MGQTGKQTDERTDEVQYYYLFTTPKSDRKQLANKVGTHKLFNTQAIMNIINKVIIDILRNFKWIPTILTKKLNTTAGYTTKTQLYEISAFISVHTNRTRIKNYFQLLKEFV